MKNFAPLLAAAALACSFTLAHAADDGKTRQQNKMTTCSAEFKATGKDGKERQAFMKECLSAKPAAAPTQQEKMKTCNADAKDMKGDARKAFMKDCLSKK